MPGSRVGEIEKMLGLFLETCRLISQRRSVRCRLLVAPDLDPAPIERRIRSQRAASPSWFELEVRQGTVQDLLPECDYAIIKSGTSTLQAMILEVPFSMVYRMSRLSYRLLKPLVSAQTFCLANLIAGKPIVSEFVQGKARPELIAEDALRVLGDEAEWRRLKQNLKIASESLGTEDAYRRAAGTLIDLIEG
jgi:lipid-A-disaccharide synthase